ncbi:hypothetical protein [Campylobacter sp. FOBRC14]|nr:hypothetical protein [Campylobacter sp. FOBRC14]EJP75427.1 hypothetical protein HMPREF1139_0682 [Campylobacter sp. FOBRC14]
MSLLDKKVSKYSFEPYKNLRDKNGRLLPRFVRRVMMKKAAKGTR